MSAPTYVPSPMECPYCGQGTMSVRDDNALPTEITEPVVCPHCHGVSIETFGRLRPPTEQELSEIDGPEYARCCRQLVERFGEPKFRAYRLARAARPHGILKPH